MDVDPIAGYAELADAAEALADRTPNAFARLLGYHVAGTQAFQEGRIDDATRLLEAAIDAAGFSDPHTPPRIRAQRVPACDGRNRRPAAR